MGRVTDKLALALVPLPVLEVFLLPVWQVRPGLALRLELIKCILHFRVLLFGEL